MRYNHTQVGYLMIYVTAAVVIFFGFILSMTGPEPFAIAVIFLIILALVSFSSLNVKIDEEYLKIRFGYGIYSKSFLLKDIGQAKAVRNHWYYGWGIRLWLWPHTVIYNVSGFDAVEIKMKNKKTYRIGTDEPKELESAIIQAIK